jgi:hypothetical protein
MSTEISKKLPSGPKNEEAESRRAFSNLHFVGIREVPPYIFARKNVYLFLLPD